MAVFRWGHSWSDAFSDLEREVDSILQSVNQTFQGLRFGRQYPPINLYDLDDHYLLTAEIAGVAKDDLDLAIANGVLTVRGGRKLDEGAEENRYRRQERPHGMWQRSISLPERVSEEGLEADLTNGILRIVLPKAQAETPRQIPVTGG
ncbi:MAG: Hsp20/alpha crystallin family protein [Rhodopirellula sp.]|nr:Hsp20/alpha crystallin family protein [Rhodopirellula sp.]